MFNPGSLLAFGTCEGGQKIHFWANAKSNHSLSSTSYSLVTLQVLSPLTKSADS